MAVFLNSSSLNMARWDRAKIPHKGWKYIGIEDLGENTLPKDEIPYEQCEMCGNERIRFVHILVHPEFKEKIRVGCKCATKMIENYADPEKKERDLKNRTKRRESFLRQIWKKTKKGFTLRYKGENITIVISKYSTFGIVFRKQWCWKYQGKVLNDINTAKFAAFDLFDDFSYARKSDGG